MEKHVREILKELGEDPTREGLIKTPERVAEMLRELTSGQNVDLDKLIGGSVFSSDTNDMVIVKDIELYSMCEHHLLPFFGKAHIGYIPNGKVIGISKIARIVDVFSKRLQIQERLTRQIAETVLKFTDALGVGVVLEAKHLCMMMRGVEKQNSTVVTSSVLGEFHDDASTRAEFFSLVKG